MTKEEQFKQEVANDPSVLAMSAILNEHKDSLSPLDTEVTPICTPLESRKFDIYHQYAAGTPLEHFVLYDNTVKEYLGVLNENEVMKSVQARRLGSNVPVVDICIGPKCDERACYIGVVVEGREVTNEDIERFVGELIQLTDHGLIKDKMTDTIIGIPLATGKVFLGLNSEPVDLGPGPRTVLLFISFSRVNDYYLRQLDCKLFHREGELPSVIWK